MRSVLLVTVLLLAVQTHAIAADASATWRGVKVMPKLGAVVKVGNETIDDPSHHSLSIPWIVQDVKGESLWVGDHRKGWVHRSQVVTLDEAPAYYTQLINSDNAKAWAYRLRGSVWSEKGDLDLAIADFGESLRLKPVAATYCQRGIAFFYKKNYEKAIADFDQAIYLDPKLDFAYNNRGIAWEAKKDYGRAIADYDLAIRLAPSNAMAYYNRGHAWMGQRQYAKAIADYTEVMRLNPNHSDVYCGAAWIRATCPDERYRNGQKAVALATKACELTKWTVAYDLGTLAAAYAEACDFDSAIKYQNKAIELNPTDAEFVKAAKERIALYKDHKPYRDE